MLYAVASAVLTAGGIYIVTQPSAPKEGWEFGMLGVGLGAALSSISAWIGYRLRETSGSWPKALAAHLIVFAVSLPVCASLGYFGAVAPEMAMRVGTSSWFVVVASFAAFILPRLAELAGVHSIAQDAGIALAGVVVAVVPFIASGAATASADRPQSISAIEICDPRQIPNVASLQYIFTDSADEPTPREWESATVVAFLNGQSLDDLRWPPLLPESMWMHRRYQLPGATTGASAAQKITDEWWNGVESMLTLGASSSTFSPGEGTFRIDRGCGT